MAADNQGLIGIRDQQLRLMPSIYPPRLAKPFPKIVRVDITEYRERGDQYIQVRVVVLG